MISKILQMRQKKEQLRINRQKQIQKEKRYNRNYKKIFNDAKKSCTICYQSHIQHDMCTITNCKHSFGTLCLAQWINKDKITCPTCVQEIKSIEITKCNAEHCIITTTYIPKKNTRLINMDVITNIPNNNTIFNNMISHVIKIKTPSIIDIIKSKYCNNKLLNKSSRNIIQQPRKKI